MGAMVVVVLVVVVAAAVVAAAVAVMLDVVAGIEVLVAKITGDFLFLLTIQVPFRG